MHQDQHNPNHHNHIPSHNRIIVTGASGVGKTTLVELLAPLLSLPIIQEVGRELCKQKGYSMVGEIPDQEGFKRDVLAVQIEKETALQSFVSDRSSIDCWVLWQRWNICSAMSYDSESYYETAKNHASIYTHIVYVPPMFPPTDDGFRWTDLDYQRQVDRLVRMTLYEWNLWDRTYTVQSSTPDSRLKEVSQWLGK